ncbi:MAG: hypothetical protein ABIS69_09105 [Sediminibacterium sp.]
MKYKFLFILSFIGFNCYSQTVTNQSSGASYPKNYTPYAIIDQKNGDTLSWYWDRNQTKKAIGDTANKLRTLITKSIEDSGYVWSPIYGTGVFSASSTCTVTTSSIKTSSIVQVGWFGTDAIHSLTPTSIYVKKSDIVNDTRFIISASQDQSDSFYYFIWNHN